MDIKRVKQIISSSSEVNVRYHGEPVWIDAVNEDGRTATVHLRDAKLEEQTTVEISDLIEG